MSAQNDLLTTLTMRHVPEDVAKELMNDVLQEHAHELAQKLRREGMDMAANRIDPEVAQP